MNSPGSRLPAEIDPDLTEWNNGEYEGRTNMDILGSHPGWNLFRDGSPQGETPQQISGRVDRCHYPPLSDGWAMSPLFSHGHFGRVLAARWIGLSGRAGTTSFARSRIAEHSRLRARSP